MSQSTAIEISKIDLKQIKCVTINDKTYLNIGKTRNFCIKLQLTKYGIFNPKLLPDVNYRNQFINIHKDDIKNYDYDAFINLNNSIANSKEIRKSFNIPEHVKYINMISKDILKFQLNWDFVNKQRTDNVTTTFINKDNNETVNHLHIDNVYKNNYFLLGNDLEFYFSLSIPNKDYTKEQIFSVNLKLEQVKYKMNQNINHINTRAELENAKLFTTLLANKKSNLISFFDIDINKLKTNTITKSYNNIIRENTYINYTDGLTSYFLESIINTANYPLSCPTKFAPNGAKTNEPNPDRDTKVTVSITDEKTKAKFREIDEFFRNNDTIKKSANISKKNSKNYKPLLTEPSIDDDEDEIQKTPSIKLELDKDYNTNLIKTEVSVNGNPIDVKQITDLDNIIKSQCTITLKSFSLFQVKQNNTKNTWGPTLKVTSMDIIPAKRNIISLEENNEESKTTLKKQSSSNEHKEEIVDVSSDEEEDKPTVQVKQSKEKQTKQKIVVEEKQTKSSKAEDFSQKKSTKIFKAKKEPSPEPSEDESEILKKIKDDSDSDEEVVTVTKKIPTKPIKQIKKVDVESDESDEEPVKVVTKSKTKVATK
jgi:hypothetical protein